MKPVCTQPFTAFVGIDWADTKHDICLQAAGNDQREFDCIAHQVARIDEWAKSLQQRFGGPIAIGVDTVQSAKGGIETLVLLIAFLSINVAVLNLLPVPILDGGQILINILETAKGSAFSARTREYILRAGLLAIALLFALVMFNDIKGLLQRFG